MSSEKITLERVIKYVSSEQFQKDFYNEIVTTTFNSAKNAEALCDHKMGDFYSDFSSCYPAIRNFSAAIEYCAVARYANTAIFDKNYDDDEVDTGEKLAEIDIADENTRSTQDDFFVLQQAYTSAISLYELVFPWLTNI